MRYIIENENGDVVLEAVSDGEGNYIIRSDTPIARSQDEREYASSDGYHVGGLFLAYFGANDSREFLARRVREEMRR